MSIDLSSIEIENNIDVELSKINENNNDDNLKNIKEEPNLKNIKEEPNLKNIKEEPNKIKQNLPPVESFNMIDRINRSRDILILKLYINEFGNGQLKPFKNLNVDKLNDSEIKAYRDEFNYILSTKSNMDFIVKAFKQTITVFESVASVYTPLNVNGLSNAIENTPEGKEIQDDLKHLVIETLGGSFSSMKPEYRLGINLLRLTYGIHEQNTKNNIISNSESVVNINTEYKDL